MTKTWIFQSNPKRFDIENALIEAKNNGLDLGFATRNYTKEYEPGQTVYFWRSQSSGKYKSIPGIIGKGKIKTYPKEMDFPPWAKNYIRGEFNRGMRVLIEIESIADANQMLTKEFLKEKSLFSDHRIIKSPEGSNFKLTLKQAKKLDQWWSQKQFSLTKGQKIKRTEVHKKHGGSGQGGINPTRYGNVLIFSDPKVGEQFGYHDGWKGESYLYSGEGQEGDMEFKKGNKAIRDHKQNGANIYLFFGSKGEVVYENQFVLDENNPYELVDAKDKNDEERQAIIFKLNPIENYKSQLPESNLEISSETTSEVVTEEAFENETSERKQEEKIIISQRKESKLLEQYRKFRKENSQSKLKRNKIKINSSTLWTDGWCEDEQMLIEAKSSSSRNHIRLAIGQLMDYRRHIEPRPQKLAILVLTKPQEDLIDLITELEIRLIYKENGTFKKI